MITWKKKNQWSWTWLTHLEKDFGIHFNQCSSNIRARFNPLKEMEAITPKSILMNARTSIKNHNKAVIKIKFILVFLFYDHSRFKTKSITNYHVFFSKMASGLKINFAKSQIGVVGVQASWIQEVAQLFICLFVCSWYVVEGVKISI